MTDRPSWGVSSGRVQSGEAVEAGGRQVVYTSNAASAAQDRQGRRSRRAGRQFASTACGIDSADITINRFPQPNVRVHAKAMPKVASSPTGRVLIDVSLDDLAGDLRSAKPRFILRFYT